MVTRTILGPTRTLQKGQSLWVNRGLWPLLATLTRSVVALQQKVAWASTLLQQMTTQTAEQRQLVDKKLADLACRADEKLKEVDMAITSVSTSVSLMEDSLTLATLALPTISDVKGG
jgi:hypothetical protein